MCRELTDRDWAEFEQRFWRQRLVQLLDRHAVVEAFRAMTAHAERAPFAYDERTRCMRRVG